MGKRGPKAKPTALRMLDGTGNGHCNPNEPKAIPGDPPCPSHLDTVAREEWFKMIELLRIAGLLSRADGTALALYCQSYSEWLAIQAEIEKMGRLLQSAAGTWKINPLVDVAHKQKLFCLKVLLEFGFTPAARTQVSRDMSVKPNDDMETFLAMPG